MSYDQVNEARKHLNSYLSQQGFSYLGAGLTKTSNGYELVIHSTEEISEPLRQFTRNGFEGIPVTVKYVGKVVAYG